MTKIFYSPDDEIATAAERFGEETRPGVGVVFNVKWRRYVQLQLIQLKHQILQFPIHTKWKIIDLPKYPIN